MPPKARRKPWHTIDLAGYFPDGQESWSVRCSCGFYLHGARTRRFAEAALKYHRRTAWQHKEPPV